MSLLRLTLLAVLHKVCPSGRLSVASNAISLGKSINSSVKLLLGWAYLHFLTVITTLDIYRSINTQRFLLHQT
jgi:hypothetical protein